jgi:hypothetical protein
MLIEKIIAESKNGLSRVSVILGGVELWFESQDTRLSVNPESFASALLLPALVHNHKLQIDMPLSQQWLEGVSKNLIKFNKWWNYPVLVPEGSGKPVSIKSNSTGVGQCFTCGVDSFHTLIHNLPKISHLIYIFGYDIPLRLKNRMNAVQSLISEIGQYYGKKTIFIKTNLKEHPLYEGVNWEHSHGSALAAIGHLLSGELRQLVIPSTFIYEEDRAWGSAPDTDHLWSSEQTEVVHFGASETRLQKVKSIVNNPLARKHLRVCWEMRRPIHNCSECEKCIRTMLCISLWGSVEQFEGFDHSIPLLKRIDNIPFITRQVLPYYRDFLESDLDEELKRAIQRLLQRSPAAMDA